MKFVLQFLPVLMSRNTFL